MAVERGRLEGVDDILLLPLRHSALTGDSADSIPAELRKAILARLEAIAPRAANDPQSEPGS